MGVQGLLVWLLLWGSCPGGGPRPPKPGTGLSERAGLATWVGHPRVGVLLQRPDFGAGTPSEVQSQDLWARPHLRC